MGEGLLATQYCKCRIRRKLTCDQVYIRKGTSQLVNIMCVCVSVLVFDCVSVYRVSV
jgi:hypothetical protein